MSTPLNHWSLANKGITSEKFSEIFSLLASGSLGACNAIGDVLA
jgi:hypothetical protein